MTQTPDPSPRKFNEEFRQSFRDLILWRRDVRRFRRDPIDPLLMHSLLELASHAPSVGHCQPWRFVLVESTDRREEVKSSFARANARALENYYGEQRAHYAKLKLEGLENAPVHVAVFADLAAEEGSGLGRRTMPETLRYSVAAAVQTLWLAARAEGLGLADPRSAIHEGDPVQERSSRSRHGGVPDPDRAGYAACDGLARQA